MNNFVHIHSLNVALLMVLRRVCIRNFVIRSDLFSFSRPTSASISTTIYIIMLENSRTAFSNTAGKIEVVNSRLAWRTNRWRTNDLSPNRVTSLDTTNAFLLLLITNGILPPECCIVTSGNMKRKFLEIKKVVTPFCHRLHRLFLSGNKQFLAVCCIHVEHRVFIKIVSICLQQFSIAVRYFTSILYISLSALI